MDDGQTMRSLVRDDAYRVERVLADGPTGRTELVTLDGEGPLVRKRMPSSLANVSAWAIAMDADEPLLPRIEELYRMPDALVVVYDYVPGKTLRELVETDGRMDPARAVAIACDICRAVGVLHARGVVHRDIAPGNVIVSDDGAHLVDLGIARQRSEGQRKDTTNLGTWGFASPEQYGFAQTDARSDVYGIGRVLGYLLTGVTPGDAYEEELDALAAVQPALVQVVRKAAAFEPSARYQSAADLAAAARAAIGLGAQEDGPATLASAWGEAATSDAESRETSSRTTLPTDSQQTAEVPTFTLDNVPAEAPAASHAQTASRAAAPARARVSYATDAGAPDAAARDSWANASSAEAPAASHAQTASRAAAPARARASYATDAGAPDAAARDSWANASSAEAPAASHAQTASRAAAPAPTPAKGPRPFSDAPFYLQVLSILNWVLLVGLALLVVATCIAGVTTGEPAWQTGHYILAMMVAVLCALFARESYRAVTLADPYDQSAHPAVDFFLTCFTYVCVFAALIFVVALVFPPK